MDGANFVDGSDGSDGLILIAVHGNRGAGAAFFIVLFVGWSTH